MPTRKLIVEKDYQSRRRLTGTHLHTAFGTTAAVTNTATEVLGDVEDYTDLYVRLDHTQLLNDIFVSGYALDQDGLANRTNPVENKQSATDTWTTDIDLTATVDAAWTDVDATNASLTFTPEVAGTYYVSFRFAVHAVPTAGNAISIATQFRLIDANSNASIGTRIGGDLQGANADIQQHVFLDHIFTFTAVAQTVRLQRRITTATNVDTNVLLGTAGAYGLFMQGHKI